MKTSERRLLAVFLMLASVLGGVLLSQRLLHWQRHLDRREHEIALGQMECHALVAEAPLWNSRAEWLSTAQPQAVDGPGASNSLLETLRQSAEKQGLEITKTSINEEEKSAWYRQFGVSFTVRGDLPSLFGWIHATLEPGSFFVVPQLRITPDKSDPNLVTAQVKFSRWYLPEFAGSSATVDSEDTP